jgi:predicted nucleic acid-binding protein
LIAAQAVNGRAQLFSLDADFARIARHVPLRLFDHG